MNRSNSPSLIGTEDGRKIGSIGDALKSMGANAEAVVRVVETGAVSDESLNERGFYEVTTEG